MDVLSLAGLKRKSSTMRLVTLHLFIILSHCQTPSSPSLPVRVTVPSPWQSLPLSQADLGLLFTNSSPFTSTQSLLLMPPSGTASKPLLRATFGSYTITQVMSEPVPPLTPSLTASLLSKTIVKEEGDRGERFKVRVLFHMRGDANRGTCVTLHAFKQTEEQKASCITQPPFGLCVVTLTLSNDWFEPIQNIKASLDQIFKQRHLSRNRSRFRNRGKRHPHVPGGLRGQSDQIQLYYSSFGIVSNPKGGPPRCVDEVLQQYERQLYYIGPVRFEDQQINKTEQSSTCLDRQAEEKLWLDSNVLIVYSKGPVRAGKPVRVSVNLRANCSAESLTIRLKVKKGLLSIEVHPVANSDLWMVNVERTTGSKHEVISIISQSTGTLPDSTGTSALSQVSCLSFEALQRNFGVAMTVSASWWVEYSTRKFAVSPDGTATSFFFFADREVVGIAPITESNTIINTAILTSQPVSLPVIVLAVGLDGKVSDVTTAVRCHSANEDIVKVSQDCSVVFVDGSESGRGSICVELEFSLGMHSGSLCLSVWAPVVPLRVFLSDSVLSPIKGWSHFSESRCEPVYQRSTIQILAQFSAQSAAQGQPTYMLGSPDWFVDVTELVRDWLRIENPYIAALDKQRHLIGLKSGITSLHVISSQWDGVLGSANVIVSSEPVTPGDLSVQLVGGLGLSINSSPSHPSIVTATVNAHNTLYNHGQEASISVWIQFDDDTTIPVNAFSGIPYTLHLSSLAESVVAVTPAPHQRILAQGDGGGPLVKAELLVSTCEPTFNYVEPEVIQKGGGAKRLAKGSGWIRVNLNMDFWPMGSEENNFEMHDVTDMFVDSNTDLYDNFEDQQMTVNSTGDYDGNDVFRRNDLEQAVLIPNHEESAVYLSPGVEKERKEVKTADRQVEIGIGAVLSLLCLSSLLFLINCLPCVLREQRNRERQEENVKDSVEEDEEIGEQQDEKAEGKSCSEVVTEKNRGERK
ncbi:transmembrane protein 132C [Puntigrus tetrazona]|uniref:transmembrane protein 132C n=1 Tax=Puntigrus tetrazona TaxID=1606681 RepID=UPI001C8AF5DA|nr:transmembrane protein 132C [Puntigrus tetrazona]